MKKIVSAICLWLTMSMSVWAFPTTGILDNFNRADESPLGNGTWSGPVGSGESRSRIIGQQVGGLGSDNSDYWSSSTFGPDAEAYATIAVIGTTSGHYFGVMVRINSPNTANMDCYQVTVNYVSSFNTVRFYEATNNSWAQLGADITQAFSANDALGMDAIGSGTNNLTGYRWNGSTWTSLGQRSDATITAANNIGTTEGAVVEFDNFGGGTVVVRAGCGGRKLALMGVGC